MSDDRETCEHEGLMYYRDTCVRCENKWLQSELDEQTFLATKFKKRVEELERLR